MFKRYNMLSFWGVYFSLSQHTVHRFYRQSLIRGIVVVSSTAGCSSSSSPLLSLHSSLPRLVGSSSVMESLLLWHLRYKQWHTPMITSFKCASCFESQMIFFKLGLTHYTICVYSYSYLLLQVQNKYYFSHIIISWYQLCICSAAV